MLERLVGDSFLDGYFDHTQISIAPENQENVTFTCLIGTYAFRRMPFGMCNAPATFHRYTIFVFSYLVKQCMEIFMDGFSMFESSFDDWLSDLRKILQRCREKNLTLN